MAKVNFFSTSLSEMSEDTLLRIHWSISGIVSFIMTLIYCSTEHGICRPQPLFFYLNNSWQETKFYRDPISLIFILSLVFTVSFLQIIIEIKKHKVKTEAEKAAKAAEVAKRNIEEANMKLQRNKSHENNFKTNLNLTLNLPNAITDSVSSNSSINIGKVYTTISNDFNTENVSHNNTLIVARAVTLCTILPMSVFLTLFTLENIDDWRPHGVLASSMAALGIVAPASILIGNSRMRKFVVCYFRNKITNNGLNFRSGTVEPILPSA